MSGLPREVIKWIQSLDLTWQIKTAKWDVTNGYLIAEIFSWYFPQDIQMHSYNNGTSLDSKQKNWYLLKLFIKRHSLDIPEEYIDGTIHCKEGAAAMLLENIYELLTNRKVKKTQTEEPDFTDKLYQEKLPMHARSTASKAVKNNLRITEIMADQNLILGAQKSQKIINDHIEHRRQERYQNPDRFQPTFEDSTMGESAAVPSQANPEDLQSMSREPSVQFKEIEVNQMDKSALYNMPIQGY
ncbi:unnamed protein product [Mytilus edulis]|uniref:Spermatogenesis-associated protein 4 n=1 Tax=Mytilus edulis TaxID=6550 RepID=A0A8S3TBW8_MYTED|nr:unnamed protein product [Mytilus edulis]